MNRKARTRTNVAAVLPSTVSVRFTTRARARSAARWCGGSRRRRTGSSTGSRSGVVLDPDGTVVRVFLLPDRHDPLQLVDGRAGGGERRVAVRGGGDDDHGDVAD